jgi:hypothetical protein
MQRYNARGFQVQARSIASNREPVNGRKYRDLREENARRMAAAMARA